jgi:hypothetical protein
MALRQGRMIESGRISFVDRFAECDCSMFASGRKSFRAANYSKHQAAYHTQKDRSETAVLEARLLLEQVLHEAYP